MILQEKRNLLRRMLRYLLISPYSWKYTLQLPYYFLKPSSNNHCQLTPLPLAQQINSNHSNTRLVIAGDIMPLNGHDIPVLSQAMRDVINRADYFIANCESPITHEPLSSKYKAMMTFKMPLAYLNGLMAQHDLVAEQCVFSVANNHSRDCLQQDFAAGVALMQQQGYHVIGHYEAAEPLICLKHQGLNMGIAAWTHLMNGERALASHPVVCRDTHTRAHNWQEIKQQYQLNCLIGLPHWGREYQHFPEQQIYQTAEQFALQGFDILLGCHSHVIQPAQWLNDTFCAFSMANLCSIDTHWRTHLIPLLTLELDHQGQLVRYQYDFFMQQIHQGRTHLLALEDCDALTRQRAQNILTLCFNEVAS